MYDSRIHCFPAVQTPQQIPDAGVWEEKKRLTMTVNSERESLGCRVHHLPNQLPLENRLRRRGRVEAIYDSPSPERASWLIMQASPCCTDSHAHISSITAPAEDEKRCRIVGSHSCKVMISDIPPKYQRRSYLLRESIRVNKEKSNTPSRGLHQAFSPHIPVHTVP